MKFEVGKFYKTRDGRKARVICADRVDSLYPVVALIRSHSGEDVCSFKTDGRLYDSVKESHADLAAEWVDKPNIDRALLPAWANRAVSQDSCGTWYCWDAVPVIYFGTWEIPDGEEGECIRVPAVFADPHWKGDWKDSLVVFE